MAGRSEPDELAAPPGSWPPAVRARRELARPVERFLAIEASSGILLLIAAAAALAWANSPWREAYFALWHTPVGIRVGSFAFERDLHFWINDGLMVIFFFVVGLEIRRELHAGELSDARRAALPLVAAVGGMVAPALIYAAFNAGRTTLDGWGIPMATDIAFALGVLALLGRRVAPALRILLLALAVIDDVGAILVIALFYSTGIEPSGLTLLGAGVLAVLALQGVGVRAPWAYVPPTIVAWAGAYAGGVHPTVAGVLVGLLTPARAWLGTQRFAEEAVEHVAGAREADDPPEVLHHLDRLEHARVEAVAPVDRLQHALHGWVAYGIMPLFALANAGVSLSGAGLAGDGLAVFLGVALGLVLGKLLGVFALSWLAVRVGLARLPTGVGWSGVAVVGLVAGIGFTMSIFVAGLALPSGPSLETAKLAILSGSLGSAVAAALVGWSVLRTLPGAGAAPSAYEAERSTED